MAVGSATVQRRVVRWAPWVAGGILALGVVTLLQVMNRPDESSSSAAPGRGQAYRQPRTVPPPKEARRVLARFVNTAVARRNLGEAWTLSGPMLRGGMNRSEWMSGAIPVIPFDVDPSAESPAKLDWSYPNEVGYSLLLMPRKGSTDKPTLFYATVQKFGKRWLVNYWASTPGPGPREDFNR